MSTLRVLARFIGLVWALLLGALALGIALYCLDGLISLGSARPDRLLNLPTAREEVGHFLDQLQTPGHVAILSLSCGAGAVIVGLLLLKGVLTRPRERLAVLENDSSGNLSSRRRALGQILRALAGYPADVREVDRMKLRVKRRGNGGRITLRMIRERGSEQASTKQSIEHSLDPVAQPFGLKTRILTRLPGEARGDGS